MIRGGVHFSRCRRSGSAPAGSQGVRFVLLTVASLLACAVTAPATTAGTGGGTYSHAKVDPGQEREPVDDQVHRREGRARRADGIDRRLSLSLRRCQPLLGPTGRGVADRICVPRDRAPDDRSLLRLRLWLLRPAPQAGQAPRAVRVRDHERSTPAGAVRRPARPPPGEFCDGPSGRRRRGRPESDRVARR